MPTDDKALSATAVVGACRAPMTGLCRPTCVSSGGLAPGVVANLGPVRGAVGRGLMRSLTFGTDLSGAPFAGVRFEGFVASSALANPIDADAIGWLPPRKTT